ncbi:glycoside hydrolase family protein [Breoghania sp.]|uniref:glycoside hydrolase family protein n=1 Tax=Breoghania sp. TaxID=2065378 RepID=UPI0029CA5EEE|nr:peptidoglycan-binding protein [Breoghania sp.]
MQTSERGKAFVAAHEGTVLRAYRDVAGVWTIGVGHTARAGGIRPKAGMTITREQALAQLEQDLRRFERRVKATGAFKAEHAFDGAVSFDFNTGRIHNASWVAHYRKGQPERAETSLMQWIKAGGRTWPGLKRRRAAEADLIFRGRYGSKRGDAADVDGGHAAPNTAEEISTLQRQLHTLKIYRGAIDGIAGPLTIAAIRTFQAAHPQLSVDGIAGPATRAALARVLKARQASLQATGGAVCAGGAAVVASTEADVTNAFDLWFLVLGGALVVALLVAILIAWRYRDEWRVLISRL